MCTLLDLVQNVSEEAMSEDEIVATVAYLINSGKVKLCGTFAGAKIDLAGYGSVVPFGSFPHQRRAVMLTL